MVEWSEDAKMNLIFSFNFLASLSSFKIGYYKKIKIYIIIISVLLLFSKNLIYAHGERNIPSMNNNMMKNHYRISHGNMKIIGKFSPFMTRSYHFGNNYHNENTMPNRIKMNNNELMSVNIMGVMN